MDVINDLPFATVRFSLVHNTAEDLSPLTAVEQIKDFGNVRWALQCTVPQLQYEEFAPWIGFMARNPDPVARFSAGDTVGLQDAPQLEGVEVETGALRGFSTLEMRGFVAPTDIGLRTYFSIDGYLYQINRAPQDQGGGVLRVSFEPSLRKDVAADTSVEFKRPLCTMRPVGDDQFGYEALAGGTYTATFLAEEVLEA